MSSPHVWRLRRADVTSTYPDSSVAHAKRYGKAMIGPLGLASDSLVTEVVSNDDYLLQHFLALGIPVLGVDPAANVAEAARFKGIQTEVQFHAPETGQEIAERHGRADLVVANNIFAHVPDIRGLAVGSSVAQRSDPLSPPTVRRNLGRMDTL